MLAMWMFKILWARLQQNINWEHPEYKLGLEKAEEPELKLPASIGSRESKRIPENTIYFYFKD